MADTDQTTIEDRLLAGVEIEARMEFTHVPTGHRVVLVGDRRSVEIVGEIIRGPQTRMPLMTAHFPDDAPRSDVRALLEEL